MSEVLAPKQGLKEHKLKLSTVVFIMYCLVAGGAFGIEEMISASGPGLTLLMLVVLPFIWAGPQALVSAELGSAIPEAGGFYKWVQRGLGEFWAFQAGWCRTVSSYLDNTIYVVLAVSYLGMLLPLTAVEAYLCKAVIIVFFTYINLRGIKDVGRLSTFFSLSVMIAFAFVAVVGFINWNQSPIAPFHHPDQSLFSSIGASLAIGMWCYSGYTSMSTLAAEIEDKTLIPKGLLILLPLSALSYILPTAAGLAALGSWDMWSTGGGVSYGHVAALAGDVFFPLFIGVAILANLSIFNAYIISISRCFFSMAEDNLVPRSLVKLSKSHSVPYIGVLSLGVFCLFACTFDFTILVTVSVILLMVDYVLVWIAGIRLRQNEPDMPRPFKIPVGTAGFILIVTPGISIAVISLFLNGTDYFLGGMFGIISSPLMYYIFKLKYGGLTANDAEKYPVNPKTKLAYGDLYRMASIFGLFALLGFVGAYVFFPWYEGAWGAEYYAETYGYENAFSLILDGIKLTSYVFSGAALVLIVLARKLEPKAVNIF
ncbi:MAG: APC family permease [Pseudomonadales bacterium]